MSFCCCDSGNEERIKKHMQRENQKHIKESNAGRDQQWKEGRNLGKYVSEQLQQCIYCYRNECINNQMNNNNSLDLPTESQLNHVDNKENSSNLKKRISSSRQHL